MLFRSPAYGAFVLFFMVGAIVVSLFFGFENMRKSWEIRRLRKQLAELSATPAHAGLDHSPAIDPQGAPKSAHSFT